MRAHIVIGLGFGDEGKGVVTDHLASLHPDSIVVRFSGGQQAGHTVMHVDKKHTFSNFASGTLHGRPSYWSHYCTFFLPTIENEFNVLESKGITPKLYIHPLAKMTTPYDVAFGRTKEYFERKDGSCGLGIGATMTREKDNRYLYTIDLYNTRVLEQKLLGISKLYNSIITEQSEEVMNYYYEQVEKYLHQFVEICSNRWIKYIEIMDYSELSVREHVIFEGSQGVMLDMTHGIFPNVTYANTTSKNALEICKKLGVFHIDVYHVTRCYQTRHGRGWMSDESAEFKLSLDNNKEEINVYNEWQEDFRVGEFDYKLLNQAYLYDDAYLSDYEGNITRKLVVTCIDQRPGWVLERDKLVGQYNGYLFNNSPIAGNLQYAP